MVAAVAAVACVPAAPRSEPVTANPTLTAPDSPLLSKPTGRRLDGPTGQETIRRSGQRITVRLRSVGCEGLGTGSGFVIDDTMLVTNRHVVEDAVVLELGTWDGRTVGAVLTSVAYADDLALVRVAEPLPVTARLVEEDAPVGEPVTVVGYPHGGQLQAATGTLLEYAPLEDQADASEVMRLSASVQPGNSGGPVLDSEGFVIGVVFGIEPATGNGLAIPASAVRDLLASGRPPAAPAPC